VAVMKKFNLKIQVDFEVEATSVEDAIDAVMDNFGPGSACGVEVLKFEVLKIDGLE
jgi:hypothetical protein